VHKRLLAVLAYVGAALSLIVAACTPFVLMGAFSEAVARTGVHVDAVYSGGTIARTVMRDGYQIDVYRPVQPHALQNVDPFVQIAFRPAASLPRRLNTELDLDSDGRPDVRVSLVMPRNPRARPSGEVVALSEAYRSFRMPESEVGFSELIAQSNGAVLVRIPVNQPSAGR
jgi:hypothetical protein